MNYFLSNEYAHKFDQILEKNLLTPWLVLHVKQVRCGAGVALVIAIAKRVLPDEVVVMVAINMMLRFGFRSNVYDSFYAIHSFVCV